MERFESLREISVAIIAHHTESDKTVIRDLFAHETGYATPKIDIRAVVFRDNKIGMVKEKMDGDGHYQVAGATSALHLVK